MAVRIALVGKHKSGRTWAADYLRSQHKFKKMAFSDGLHVVIKRLYGYGIKERVRWETGVRIYDALYAVDKTIWCGYIGKLIDMTTLDIVIDDPRYLNEVQFLKDKGFTIVRIVAPEARRTRKLQMYKKAGAGLLDIYDLYSRDFNATAGVDYSIYNDDKESTRKALDKLVLDLRKLDIGSKT